MSKRKPGSPGSDSSRSPSPEAKHRQRKPSKHTAKLGAVDPSLFAKGSDQVSLPRSPSSHSPSRGDSAVTTRVLATPNLDGAESAPLFEVPMYLKIITTGLAPPDAQIEAGTTALIRASFEGACTQP